MNNRLFVDSVGKAFEVLEAFSSNYSDLSLLDIMSVTGLNKSAAQRYTYTLNKLGYLRKNDATRRYSLSNKVLESANNFLSVDTLVNTATPYIVELRRELGMRIGVGCLHGNMAMYLIPLQSNKMAFKTAHPGFKVPLYCTSTGRVLLAYRDNEEVKQMLNCCDRKKSTPHTITEIDRIMDEIKKVRKQGFCITDQELITADINIATAIFNSKGEVIATVTASGSKNKWTREALENDISVLIMEVARAISSTS